MDIIKKVVSKEKKFFGDNKKGRLRREKSDE
jgi:hypothetical protein